MNTHNGHHRNQARHQARQTRLHHRRPTLYEAIEAALSDRPGWVEVARLAMEGRRR